MFAVPTGDINNTAMKNFKTFLSALCAALCLFSCDFNLQKTPSAPSCGYLSLRFGDLPAVSKAYGNVPDTSEFRISILSQEGQRVIFQGFYYDIPAEMELAPGKYTVSAQSCEFCEPLFDCPQYGYTQDVEIFDGKTSCVILDCTQTNAGVRLIFDPAFRSSYPSAQIYVSSAKGRLLYGYNERRTGYFLPGEINVSLFEGNSAVSIANRTVKERETLVLKLHSAEYATLASGIEFLLDTTVFYTNEDLYPNGSEYGWDTPPAADAISVQQAGSHIGETDVWVRGYIAGVSKSSSSSEFQSPFSSNTNLLLSPTANNTDRESCIAVELAKGNIRDALNLKDHPGYLNRKIRLKGNIEESYFGLTGLKKIKDFEWE